MIGICINTLKQINIYIKLKYILHSTSFWYYCNRTEKTLCNLYNLIQDICNVKYKKFCLSDREIRKAVLSIFPWLCE